MVLKCIYGFFGHMEDRLIRKDKIIGSKLYEGFRLMQKAYTNDITLTADEWDKIDEITEMVE